MYRLKLSPAILARLAPADRARVEAAKLDQRVNGVWIVNADGLADLFPSPVPAAPRPAKRAPAALTAIPRDRWPIGILALASLASEGDKGAGDTLARTLGKTGETFKAAYERIMGKSCGCSDRQAKMNLLYPY